MAAMGLKRLAPLAVAALSVGFGSNARAATGNEPGPAEPSYQELKEQVRQMQERMDRLENGTAARDAKVRAADIDKTVDAVLSDADRRSQLLAADGGFTAGYDKGFFIGSGDGNFLLKPSVQFQFRYVGNFNESAAGPEETDAGFEVRRARFRFDGNVINKDLTYSFVFDTNRVGGGVTLLDAWAQYRFAKQWAVKLGQFKESAFHEKDVPFTAQLAVERSLVDAVLAGNLTDRVQGVALIYGGTKDDAFRAEAAFHDGANSKNTSFQDSGASNFGIGGRVEYKAFGNWADYRDFTAKGTKDQLLVVGGGFDFTERDENDAVLASIDAQYEHPSGLGIYGSLHADYTKFQDNANGVDDALGDDNRVDYGALVQAGYVIAPQWEIFGRYDVLLLDDDIVGDNDTFNELTAGVNYYLGDKGSALHRGKITLDIVYLPDGSPSNQTGLGVLAGDENQFVIRGQFQLVL